MDELSLHIRQFAVNPGIGPKGWPAKSISNPATITRIPLSARSVANFNQNIAEKLRFVDSYNLIAVCQIQNIFGFRNGNGFYRLCIMRNNFVFRIPGINFRFKNYYLVLLFRLFSFSLSILPFFRKT